MRRNIDYLTVRVKVLYLPSCGLALIGLPLRLKILDNNNDNNNNNNANTIIRETGLENLEIKLKLKQSIH